MKPFPIQAAKIQPPILRDETLARDRLLDWLDAKIHHRLVLVIAEAGYGKTTLLADFSRRTRLRTIWYRLDETDADWVTVLHHLVAAGRRSDPSFASATWSLLAELGSGGAPLTTILGTFIRELQGIGDHGVVLILDDYHLVEAVPELQQIVREIVTHAPERLTVVLMSRHSPALPIARLRALGEVAELGRDALRFEPTETERLFRETYGRPLEPDVLAELDRRTEGWAASLQLVRSALRERSAAETRTFIASLSGARGTLHDFLAEEVVGDLDPRLQSFLMRTSILSTLPEAVASVAAGIGTDETRDHLESATRIGLLPQASDGTGLRYHPLVRDFLEDRLRREIGAVGVDDLHRLVARYGEGTDWKLAAHHYEAAGDLDDLHRVMVASMQDIMGGGGFALAESYVRRYPDLEADPTFGLFLSRRDAYSGDFTSALTRAQAAVAAHPSASGTHLSHLALANLATISFEAGDYAGAMGLAEDLDALDPDPALKAIARGTANFAAGSTDGDLDQLSRFLEGALVTQRERGYWHYCGISHLNLAYYANQRGRAEEALQHAAMALDLLSSSSAGTEIETVLITSAQAHFFLGDEPRARDEIAAALGRQTPEYGLALLEAADLEATFGDPDRAEQMLRESDASYRPQPMGKTFGLLVASDLISRNGGFEEARHLLQQVDPRSPSPIASMTGRWHLAAARVEIRSGGKSRESLQVAKTLFKRQRARHWLTCAEILEAMGASDPMTLNEGLSAATNAGPIYLTVCADDVVARLGDLDLEHLEAVRLQAVTWPRRWRPIVRKAMGAGGSVTSDRAAAILDEIGETADIGRLRAYARAGRRSRRGSFGRNLARRLAAQAHFDDLGHVRIQIGSRLVDGSEVRRKVLALACFLLTKSGFAATRDQVLEALWPDLDPTVAVNSLNQTVYFLRRVFEWPYREDESANYVHHDGEVVRLDPALVTCQSVQCRELAHRARATLDPALIEQLSTEYRGRFAIDFEYEDWASPYRETLHAAYLDVVEQSMKADSAAGRFDQAASVARRSLDLDPEAASIEHALLLLYRATGSHSAAAEQQSHYAAGDDTDGAGADR